MRILPAALFAFAVAVSGEEIAHHGAQEQSNRPPRRNTKALRGSRNSATRDLQRGSGNNNDNQGSKNGGNRRPRPFPPVAAPTDAPVASPTDAPVAAPTDAPVVSPIDAPVAAPTGAPVAFPTDAPVATSPTLAIPSPSEIARDDTNNMLTTTITIAEATYTIPGSRVTVTGRLLNGEYPGPTIRIKAGDTLNIVYQNNLNDNGSVYLHNEYSANDDSNMHFHGLHVSGELPSDDVTHAVYPGQSYNYITTLPDGHMGGTHWQHPHKHGSTTLQVGGGALQAIIVEDPDGFLPQQVADAREVLFLAQYFEINRLEQVASDAMDGVLAFTIPSGDRQEYREFITVNGQYKPVINIDAMEWIRLRVIWANFLEGDLDLGIPGCEMKLLAKDGIYIQDFPREITDAAVVPGGRADIMVRCPTANTNFPFTGIVDDYASIQTSSTVRSSQDLAPWTPAYPEYLTDLQGDGKVTSGCECDTALGGTAVNNIPFPSDGSFLHTTHLNAVTSRHLSANTHPYHQHVYPFQLIGEGFVTAYNKGGDWHDVIKGTGEIRFRPTEFTGKLMLHCHRLVHEDLGMMAMEYVGTAAEGTCSCTGRNGTPGGGGN